MDTEEKGSGQQQKQVAKGKEFAFKIYLAYDPPSPPSRPFTLNASIFFLIGFGLSDLRWDVWEGVDEGSLSLYIY